METRKLQQVGGGTYTVSIPKTWATDHGLETGSTVHLYTHDDGSLIVRDTEKDRENLAAARIELEGRDPALVERSLVAAYGIGFDRITLVRSEPFTDVQCRAVRSTVRRFSGTEISEEREAEITVHNLLDTADVSVRQSVVQLQFVALSMHRRALTALLEGDTEAHEQLGERNAETDRLFAMLSRHVHRSMVSFEELDRLDVSRMELFDYYATASKLEKLADRSVAIARLGALRSGPLPDGIADEIRAMGEAVERVVDDATTVVLDRTDIDRANDALDRCAETVDEIDALHGALVDGSMVDDEAGADALVVSRVLDNLVRTVEYGEEIATVAFRAVTLEETMR